jgi:hypothetical protein
VRRSLSVTLAANQENCAEQLARFFPRTTPVRIPVQVTSLRTRNSRLRESTVVEFGARDYAIFLSTLPLEFDDRIRIERDKKGCIAEATVIAVQYHEGRKAVAVRFSEGPCDWVTTL